MSCPSRIVDLERDQHEDGGPQKRIPVREDLPLRGLVLRRQTVEGGILSLK